MSAFYLLAGLQLVSLLLLGLPMALGLTQRDGRVASIGWILLAPALGATIYLSVGTAFHSFGLRSVAVFPSLLAVAIGACWMLCRDFPVLRATACWGCGACVIGAGAALGLNCADYTFAGLDYFPLTNDDTFSYLGLVDQIRQVGWITPRITYAAGYFPPLDHALKTRTPGIVLVADFADMLRLDTHAAFFLTQRTALAVIALGAAGIVILVTRSLLAALLCFASLTAGNILLHQIVQQFNSSTSGTMIAPVIIAAASWTFRAERSDRESVVGYGLTGWACGTMAITSMEAHPFYLTVVGAMAACAVAAERNWTKAARGALAFAAHYVASSAIFLAGVWPALINQFTSAAAGHPGDWIANPAFLMQAAGIAIAQSDRLSDYALVPRVTAFAVLASLIMTACVIIWYAVSSRVSTDVAKRDLVSLTALTAVLWVLQIGLYMRGSGYALLKVTDYFAYAGAVLVSVAYVLLGLTRRRAISVIFIGLTAGYGVVALLEKDPLLGAYGDRTRFAPLPGDYRLRSVPANWVLAPDMSPEFLNLFLYENRHGLVPISFNSTESNRFKIDSSEANPPQAVVRMPWVRPPRAILADITYPEIFGALPTVTPAPGQIHIVQSDANWLAPEFQAPMRLWRWLSRSGSFTVFGPVAAEQRELRISLMPGPDLREDNQIEIRVAGRLLTTVIPAQLPHEVVVPLPEIPAAGTLGELRITGQVLGIHQLSVSGLLTGQRG